MIIRSLAASLLAAATLAVPVTAVTSAAVPAPAEASSRGCTVTSTPEARSRDFIAAKRAEAKVGQLRHRTHLRDVARRHALRMCNQNRLHHNPNLGTDVNNWRIVAENVGVGPTTAAINAAFMNSTSHRKNILDRRLTQVGVGVARDDSGRLFIVQVYRTPR